MNRIVSLSRHHVDILRFKQIAPKKLSFRSTNENKKQNPGDKNETISRKNTACIQPVNSLPVPLPSHSIPWRADNPQCPLFPPSILHDRHGCKNRAESRLVEKSRSSRGNVFGERINTAISLLVSHPFSKESFRGNLLELGFFKLCANPFLALYIRNKLGDFLEEFLLEDPFVSSGKLRRSFSFFPFLEGVVFDGGGGTKERGWKKCDFGQFRVNNFILEEWRMRGRTRWVYVILLGNARFVTRIFVTVL